MTRAVLDTNTVLAYPKLAAIFGDVDEIVELITLASHVVRPALTRDLQNVEGIRIVTPANFTHELDS